MDPITSPLSDFASDLDYCDSLPCGSLASNKIAAGDVLIERYSDGTFYNFVRAVDDDPNVIRLYVDRWGRYPDGEIRHTDAPIYVGARSVQPSVILRSTYDGGQQ